jgi:hypothetical protein
MIVSEKRPETSRIRLMILADEHPRVDKTVYIRHIVPGVGTKIASNGEKLSRLHFLTVTGDLGRGQGPWSSDMSRPSGLGYGRRRRATSYR